MNTQEMHDRLLENLIKLTGKSADELVPGLHSAGVEAHAAGDGAVNEIHKLFNAEMAAEVGISEEAMEAYTPMYTEDHDGVLPKLSQETGKSEDELHKAFEKVGGKYGPAYSEAKRANHEGFVVRAARDLNLDREIIEKAFIFE